MQGLRTIGVALAAGALALLAACSSGTTTTGAAAPTGAEGKKVGFLVFDQELDSFVTVMVKAVEDGAKAQGIELTTVDGKNDVKTEEAALDQFTADKVDAILIYPGDPTSLAPAVQRAARAGIPVFTVNLGLDESAPVITYVGSDDVVYGQEQAQLVAEALGETGGTVGLLEGEIGTSAQINRTAGFKDELAKHPNITIVEEQPDDWDPAKSLALVQQWVAKYPAGSLDAIVAQGPQVVGGADWARENGRDDIVFVAGDYNQEVQKAIEDGSVYGTTDQNPRQQGEKAITAVGDWLAGRQDQVTRPAEITPLPDVTKENVARTEPAW
jgi:ABC-type sugar transport system substrate-binding protein